MKYKYLSNSFAEKIPVYGGETKINVNAVKSISGGDSANVFEFTLQNHWGTHIDASEHFFPQGKRINDYSADQWVFMKPQVVSVSLKAGQLLVLSGWEKGISKDTDILIFKSGWTNFRSEDKYYKENPGIDPSVAFFLRQNFPNVKAVGIDWISISSVLNRDIGRSAHKNFLDPNGHGDPILLIEDMDLKCNLTGLSIVIALPLRIDNIDSAPCTIIGGFND